MKKLILSLLVVTAFVAAPVSLFAQESATSLGRVNIITPISITNNSGLDFGSVALIGDDGGVLQVLGVATPTATVKSGTLDIVTSTPTSATFTVNGANGDFGIVYSATTGIAIGSDGVTLDLIGDTDGSSAPTTGTISGGTATIRVGGEVTIPDGIDAGLQLEASAFTLTVAYN